MTHVCTQHPTTEEVDQFSIRAFKGIELGIGKADPLASTNLALQARYPDHLILIQAGTFLHGYDRTAYALHTLKNYKLKFIGTTEDPHIRIGFPVGNFKKRLWSMVQEFGIPYVVSLGNQTAGYTVYVSAQPAGNAPVLSAVSDQLLGQIINDLQQRGKMTIVAARQMLANPDTSGFKLKSQAQELDTGLLDDILRMPRDVRAVYGENLRATSARIMHGIYAYGNDLDKKARLRSLSADIDLMKYYLTQGQRLKNLKLPFESRAGLAVELGNLLGGLIRAKRVQP